MFAPRVFVSMLGALAAFAIVTFILTGSAWTTAWQTLACAILIQVGYFAAVLVLVAREGRERRKQVQVATAGSMGDGKERQPLHVPGRTGHFN